MKVNKYIDSRLPTRKMQLVAGILSAATGASFIPWVIWGCDRVLSVWWDTPEWVPALLSAIVVMAIAFGSLFWVLRGVKPIAIPIILLVGILTHQQIWAAGVSQTNSSVTTQAKIIVEPGKLYNGPVTIEQILAEGKSLDLEYKENFSQQKGGWLIGFIVVVAIAAVGMTYYLNHKYSVPAAALQGGTNNTQLDLIRRELMMVVPPEAGTNYIVSIVREEHWWLWDTNRTFVAGQKSTSTNGILHPVVEIGTNGVLSMKTDGEWISTGVCLLDPNGLPRRDLVGPYPPGKWVIPKRSSDLLKWEILPSITVGDSPVFFRDVTTRSPVFYRTLE